jgi:hypothetical protein
MASKKVIVPLVGTKVKKGGKFIKTPEIFIVVGQF